MSTPNLDAISHWWVAAMAGYNFKIEYVRSTDNKVADAFSRVGRPLNEDAVKELLSHTTCYCVPRVEADDPRVVEEHCKKEGEVIMQARMLAETKKNYRNLANLRCMPKGFRAPAQSPLFEDYTKKEQRGCTGLCGAQAQTSGSH